MSRIHRFYIGDEFELRHSFWLHELRLLHQWNKVLRYQEGQEVLLFDGIQTDRLYRITVLKDNEAHLDMVTDYERQLPARDVYLLWSLLKKDKNDWVLQKATELGVSHFVPLLAKRSEKTGFDPERARKIIIEAAEQCGRSDIPSVREPMLVETALNHIGSKVPLLVCEQASSDNISPDESPLGVLIGPEGGWSEGEKELFSSNQLRHIGLGSATLRAETAAIAAATKLLI